MGEKRFYSRAFRLSMVPRTMPLWVEKIRQTHGEGELAQHYIALGEEVERELCDPATEVAETSGDTGESGPGGTGGTGEDGMQASDVPDGDEGTDTDRSGGEMGTGGPAALWAEQPDSDPDGFDGEAAPEGATPTTIETPDDGYRLTIEYPLEGFTPEKLANLTNLVKAKEPLLRRSLGAEALPIKMTDNALQFPWFGSIDAENVKAYTVFIERLCKTALQKTRVTAKERGVENEKFAMRVWLISLGMVGDDYKAARKILLRNLAGNSAFRNGAPPKADESEGGADE